jgi:hypothetical protein
MHLLSHLAHGGLVRLRHGTLMVTKDGDHAIGLIVSVQFLLYRRFHRRILVELLLEGDRSVVSTEHLRCETLHV